FALYRAARSPSRLSTHDSGQANRFRIISRRQERARLRWKRLRAAVDRQACRHSTRSAMSTQVVFQEAFETRDIERFLSLMFPASWDGVAARIIESGVEMSTELCPWAPRWSFIPPTERKGKTDLEKHVKSCMFRVHDCLHQLWGLPTPSPTFTE